MTKGLESWKKDIAKKYIEKEVLNNDLLKLQSEFQQIKTETQKSLKELKEVFSPDSENLDKQSENHFGSEKLMNILFNEKGNLRSKIGYEFNKLKTIDYYIISEEGKKNLDLLYSELQKAQSEQELSLSLGMEFNSLKQEVSSDSKNNSNETDSNQIEKKIEKLDVDEKYIYQQARLYGITDDRQIAYILATVKGESNFKNIKEIDGENKNYGKNGYYGRGFVQLTHKGNYKKFTQIIQGSRLNFKDNSGNLLTKNDLDLVQNPDTVLKSNDLAAFILVYGMKNGSFTGKKLSEYINNEKKDFHNARRIINGINSSPEKYAKKAEEYLNNISNKESMKNRNSILIGPEILANKVEEFGGLGNSMMTGFSKYFGKNMNGMEGKTTKTHPDAFKSKEDVLDRKNKHPGVKSFAMYFGANTKDNNRTLSDLEQWSKWLQEEGIQPVLSTCIGSDNNPHLNELNPEIKKLGENLEIPVLDFAGKYDKEKEIFAMGTNKHPSGTGYKNMAELIKESANIV